MKLPVAQLINDNDNVKNKKKGELKFSDNVRKFRKQLSFQGLRIWRVGVHSLMKQNSVFSLHTGFVHGFFCFRRERDVGM